MYASSSSLKKMLAERCGAVHSYIRQIESKTGHPSFAFIEKLAKAMNIEPYKLFIDETRSDSNESANINKIEVLKSEFMEKATLEFNNVIKKISTP